MNKEQMTQEQRAQLIEKLRAEYNDLNGKIARLNAFLCDIDFVKKVPDPIEQELMSMQFRSMKGYLDNLRGRIMFQEAQQLREENARKQLDEWKKMKGHIKLVNLDEQHHCGQDVQDADDACCQARAGRVDYDAAPAASQTGDSLKELEGMQVIDVKGVKCDYCATRYNAPCVKVELVGGCYLCLAPIPNSIITE